MWEAVEIALDSDEVVLMANKVTFNGNQRCLKFQMPNF